MAALKNLNLALSFLLELLMLVAFGYWGFNTQESSAAQFLLGIGIPVVAIVIWGIFNAPQSKRRLPRTPRTILEVVMFALGALAFAAAGQTTWAMVFVALIIINQIGIFIWQQ